MSALINQIASRFLASAHPQPAGGDSLGSPGPAINTTNLASRANQASPVHWPEAEWDTLLTSMMNQMFHALHQSAGWPRLFDFPDIWWESFFNLEKKLLRLKAVNDMVGYRAACELFQRATLQWIKVQKQKLPLKTQIIDTTKGQ